jgi:hypothetical protein
VRDLLGDTTRPAAAFPAEEAGNADAQGVSRLLVDQYASAAQGIAERATADARLARTIGCDVAKTGEDGCAKAFVAAFGERAFRRPLVAAEAADLLAVYTNVRGRGADFRTGVGAIIRTVLQAPEFLYRLELGEPAAPGVTYSRPTSFEMASRLSYFLWGSMPDDVLMAEARAGRLVTKEQVLAQARRMLDDGAGRAKEMVRDFHIALLGLGSIEKTQKDIAVFPKFGPEIPALLKQEVERFVDAAVWEGAGDLGTLLTASFGFANPRLARFYGLPAVNGDAFVRVEHNPARRAGLLTHAAVLANLSPGNDTNPVVRGAWIRSHLFCSPAPSPPANLVIKEPTPSKNLTTRERFAAHRSDPSCAACHALMDPIGLALESYDAVGLWRSTENGKPVDALGEIVGTDVAGAVNGPIELARKIATSADARKCLTGKWLAAAYGRSVGEADRCAVEAVDGAFAKSGGKVRDLLLALTQSDAFLFRGVTP